uniref:Uncharacterized protein n=1 Tax=Tetradesmus obliquus TaxID=3088 RepID=A0A383W778_TETOB
MVVSVPGLGTFNLQDVLQQGEGGDDMVYVAAAAAAAAAVGSAAAPAAQEVAPLILGDSVMEQEMPPATADVLAQLHLSLQQQQHEGQALQGGAYPASAAAAASLTDSWIASTL